MQPIERSSREVKLLNQSGRAFMVKLFMNPEGYVSRRANQSYSCATCGSSRVMYRAEIYNHLVEPIGSEYFCAKDKPEFKNALTD